jgi:hypothetical protein
MLGSKRSRNGSSLPRTGCLFLLGQMLIASLLLLVNVAIVAGLYRALIPLAPDWLAHPRVGQAVMFVIPVALIPLQWWLAEFAADCTRAAATRIRKFTSKSS